MAINKSVTHIARRPTLLMGYGRFGLKVMEQLLYNASIRDVLVWEAQSHKASIAERHLRDLALLHIKDRFQVEQQHAADSNSGDEFEMFQDLYSQIKTIDPALTADEHNFAQWVANIVATQLLSAASRNRGEDDTLPLGLDVIVLLHPEDAETVGFLNRLLQLTIERIISQNANLRRGTGQSNTLSCIKIIDFDNYWEHSGHALRQAIFRSVSFWQKRRDKNKAGFERIYFIDGRPRHNTRDETHRISEVALFLEFLLFEGQRTGDLEVLYKTSAGPQESIVSSFGIRVIENNTALLRSLASAWFCVGWLGYMVRTEPTQVSEQPQLLRENLAPYLPDKLESTLGKANIQQVVANYFTDLETTLLALSPNDPAWPQNIRTAYEQMQKALEIELTQLVHQRVKDLSENYLAHLSDKLKSSIHADMDESREPVTLSAVMVEINAALQQLDNTDSDNKPEPSTASHAQVWQHLTRKHAEYLHFKSERIDVNAHKQWWPLSALLLSLGLTPLLVSALEDVPAPDNTQTVLLMLYDALQTLNNPLFVSVLLFGVGWFIGVAILQGRIRRRIEWSTSWWHQGAIQKKPPQADEFNAFAAVNDAYNYKKGRLIALIRRYLQADGALRQPLEQFATSLLDNMALSIRAEVRRELRRVQRRLAERQREIIWLEAQLTQYLTMHHLTYALNGLEQQTRLGRETTDVRYAVEDIEDFKSILRVHPPHPDRYRAAQAEVAPFKNWNLEYSENNQGFLYPINFVETVAEKMALNPHNDSETKLTQQFGHFLAQRGDFAPAFHWPPSEGVSTEQRYCVLPTSWRRFETLLHDLHSAGIANTHILNGHDDSRAYLLRIQTGIDVNCLIE